MGVTVTRDSPRSSAESSRRPSTPRSNGLNGINGVNGVNGANGANGRERSDSRTPKHDSAELVTRRLKEALTDASERSADYIKLDRAFVEAIILSLEQRREQVDEISHRLDTFKVCNFGFFLVFWSDFRRGFCVLLFLLNAVGDLVLRLIAYFLFFSVFRF